MYDIRSNLFAHQLGELRYAVNCMLEVAYGCVATPWNRAAILRHCASPKAPTVGAIHHLKRTLHHVQLQSLG